MEITKITCANCGHRNYIEEDGSIRPTKFDPEKIYGNFIEIVPSGQVSIHKGSFAVLDGLSWDNETVDFAEKACEADSRKWIPEEYRDQVKIIHRSPDIGDADPYARVGSVGWKYKPLQKGQ